MKIEKNQRKKYLRVLKMTHTKMQTSKLRLEKQNENLEEDNQFQEELLQMVT